MKVNYSEIEATSKLVIDSIVEKSHKNIVNSENVISTLESILAGSPEAKLLLTCEESSWLNMEPVGEELLGNNK